jgi:hypothetical protein
VHASTFLGDVQTHKRPHTSRPASPSDPGGFDTVLLAASTTTGCGNLRPPAVARSTTTRQLFYSTGFGRVHNVLDS